MARHLKKYDCTSERMADGKSGVLVNPYVVDINGDIDYNSQTLTEDPNFKSYFWVDRFYDFDFANFNLTYNYNPDIYGILYYSTDTGETKTWTEYTEPIAITGRTYFKRTGNIPGSKIFTSDSTSYNYNIGGNIFSLVIGDDYLNENYEFNLGHDFCNGIFKGDTKVANAENLVYNFIYKIKTQYPFGSLSAAFSGATQLQVPPAYIKLPYAATYTLTNSFRATSLSTAPEFIFPNPNAITNVSGIFRGCSSLSNVKCLKTGSNISFTNWLNGVSASGTFTKNKDATWVTGRDGIPEGWTVVDSE